MTARYIVTIPNDKAEELHQALTSLAPKMPAPEEVILGETHRVARIIEAQVFYDERLREECPQLRPWEDLDQETRSTIAFMMADSRDYQFGDLYQVDWDELYTRIAESSPDAVGPARQGLWKTA